MVTINTVELFLKAAELLNDGYDKVEVTELEQDNEWPACLSFEALESISENECFGVDYESIDDCTSDDTPTISVSTDGPAPYVFTFEDLSLTLCAFENAIENCRNCLDDKTISASERSDITSHLKRFQSFASKLNSFLKS